MQPFSLDTRLESDTIVITTLGLCQLRLMKDKRWPWLIAVPLRNGVSEFFDLAPLDQTMLTFEVNEAAKALKAVTKAEKINIATIGNIVRQMHVHIIARSEGDANWPGPVWGHGKPEPYSDEEVSALAQNIAKAMSEL